MRILRFFLAICLVLTFGFGCSSKTTITPISDEPQPDNSTVSSQQQTSAPVETPLKAETTELPQQEEALGQSEEENEAVETVQIDEEVNEETAETDEAFNEFDEFEEEFGDAEEQEVWDPLEGYNRAMTSFNDKLYLWVLNPVAKCYRWVVPECVRRGVDRFFTNLLYPIRATNNLLQGKFKNTGEETLRFVTNSTIGIFGFFDPAKEWFGLEPHDEDLGQTLGYYGVGAGPHIVLPFFGPRNLRDALTMYPETVYLDPKSYYVEGTVRQVGVYAFDTVNEVSLNIGAYESLKKDALDFYKFLRDSYEQKRIREIEE